MTTRPDRNRKTFLGLNEMIPPRYGRIHKKHPTNKVAFRHFCHHTLIPLPHPVPWHKTKTNNVVCCRHFVMPRQENSVFSISAFERHSSKPGTLRCKSRFFFYQTMSDQMVKTVGHCYAKPPSIIPAVCSGDSSFFHGERTEKIDSSLRGNDETRGQRPQLHLPNRNFPRQFLTDKIYVFTT